jgi:acylphosphatase
MVRAHIVVSGRVQGVFFRAYSQREAVLLGVTGWVKNLFDGRVEIMAEGEKEQVKRLIAAVKQGPPQAYVEDADVEWLEIEGEFEDFKITW